MGILLLLQRSSQAGNPAIVALEGAAEDKLLNHDGSEAIKQRGRMGGAINDCR